MDNTEIWAKIHESYNNVVSNLGNVGVLENGVVYKRAISDNGNGYKIYSFRINGKKTNFYIHRLVAIKFIDNPFNKKTVNHIDGDKSNNHYSNLEWLTPKENTTHAIKNGLIKSGINRKDNPKFKPIINLETGIYYNNVQEASFAHNIIKQTLYTWLNNPYLNKTSLVYA